MKGRWIEWSDAELAWIEARREMPRRELYEAFVAHFGRDDVSQANLTALCKRRGWFTGRDGRFSDGHSTWNKGKQMPFNANSARTRFKKGNVPHTYRGVGHESIDAKDGYVWIIVEETNPHTGAPTRRVMKHRWLWEQVNGPVPDGHALKCLDGDKTNTDPSNWEAVPRGLLPRLNGRFGRNYDHAPAEFKPTLLAVAKLEHAAREIKKGTKP